MLIISGVAASVAANTPSLRIGLDFIAVLLVVSWFLSCVAVVFRERVGWLGCTVSPLDVLITGACQLSSSRCFVSQRPAAVLPPGWRRRRVRAGRDDWSWQVPLCLRAVRWKFDRGPISVRRGSLPKEF